MTPSDPDAVGEEPRTVDPGDDDQALVTHVEDVHAQADADETDGSGTDGGGTARVPCSSASMPRIVALMLDALDVSDGMAVLEIGTGTGTGTGYNAPLLCDRLGDRRVVSVEVLRGGGPPYRGRGTGEPEERRARATASGPVIGDSAFMWNRGETPHRGVMATVRARPRHATPTTTGLDQRSVFGDEDATSAAGLLVPHCRYSVGHGPGGEFTLWLADRSTRSWASVDHAPGADTRPLQQHGPRAVWSEVEAAYAWWQRAGSPARTRYCLAVTPTGQHLWLDTPDHAVGVGRGCVVSGGPPPPWSDGRGSGVAGRLALRGARQWSGVVTRFVKRPPTGWGLGFMPRWSLSGGGCGFGRWPVGVGRGCVVSGGPPPP
ncbi:hypothetical protein ACIQ7D_34385 [Streptomyces sp. NPDC096310]|uniref:hypothetical protein n=1 Tax=Streptomyces sp. NPDC096310 TaxID=3366082 RepID=UPI003822A4C2